MKIQANTIRSGMVIEYEGKQWSVIRQSIERPGKGAVLNNHRLRVSARTDLGDALIGTGIPFRGHGNTAAYGKVLDRVMPEVAGIRRFGSAALDLAYVAAGRFDGYWETGLQMWDIAAGVLLVREAGGYVTEVNGGKNPIGTGSVLASNQKLHKSLQDLVNRD